MAMVNLDMATIEANPPGAGVWITNVVTAVACMYLLAWLFTKLQVESAVQGALYGFLIAFVFITLNRMTNDMFAKNPYGLSWIVGGYSMATLTLGGLILGAWRKYKE